MGVDRPRVSCEVYRSFGDSSHALVWAGIPIKNIAFSNQIPRDADVPAGSRLETRSIPFALGMPGGRSAARAPGVEIRQNFLPLPDL